MKAPAPKQGTFAMSWRSHWVARVSSRRTGDLPPWRTAATVAREQHIARN